MSSFLSEMSQMHSYEKLFYYIINMLNTEIESIGIKV